MSLADACCDFLATMWDSGVSKDDLKELRSYVANYANDIAPGGYPPEAIDLLLAAIDEWAKKKPKMDVGTFVSLVSAVHRTYDDLPGYPEETLVATMRQLWPRHPKAKPKAKPAAKTSPKAKKTKG
jgi:hypothetical protein